MRIDNAQRFVYVDARLEWAELCLSVRFGISSQLQCACRKRDDTIVTGLIAEVRTFEYSNGDKYEVC